MDVMLPVETLATFFGASLLLAITPGPDNLFVFSQSLLRGSRAGLAVTFGLCTGLIFHTSLVVLGLAAILQTSALAFTLLKILGAAYLVYLAWGFFTAAPLALDEATAALHNLLQLYRRGIFMNISNPKVSLFFLAFLPQFTQPAMGSLSLQLILLGALFLLSTLLVFGGIALLAEKAGSWLLRSAQAQRVVNRLAGVLFLVLAGKLAVTQQTLHLG